MLYLFQVYVLVVALFLLPVLLLYALSRLTQIVFSAVRATPEHLQTAVQKFNG
jgi:hypothetical protein